MGGRGPHTRLEHQESCIYEIVSLKYQDDLLYFFGGVCGRAVNTSNSLDLEVRDASLTRCFVFLDNELCSTLSLFSQAPVVQTLDNAIHRINHYPADKYYRNQLRYPLDRDLSGG